MYAIVETGGKQYRAETGTTIQVERLPGDVGAQIELSQVHLVHGDAGILIGQPLISGAKVTAEIVRQGRTRSITVFKKKRRKNYRRKRGHRQDLTLLRITEILTDGKKPSKTPPAKTKKAKAAPKNETKGETKRKGGTKVAAEQE